jgi:iron complex transport system ATP-binding protein
MLEASRATYAINGKRLVHDVDLALRPGKVVAVVGPNGAGKSTLLRLLAGEIAPTAGSIRIDGRELKSVLPGELARRRAVVAQSTALSFPFTVLEVVLLGATVPGFVPAEPRALAIAGDTLRTVGLSGFEQRLFTDLSGGERQRVHIARALCQLETAKLRPGETAALLLDEPTANLDLSYQGAVLGEARCQAGRGLAVLAILHDLNLAAAYADEIVLMSRGRIVVAGAPSKVLREDLLSEVYGCIVRMDTLPGFGHPIVLPPVGRGQSCKYLSD